MDLLEGLRSRSSIRCFLQKPVAQDIVASILEYGSRAPSASNQQPWHFIAVTGDPLTSLCAALQQARANRQTVYDPSKGNTIPAQFVERTRKLFRELRPHLSELGEAQRSFIEAGSFRFYGAPVVILLAMHRQMPSSRCVDIGMAAQNIMLAAHARGLGTCAIALALLYSEVIREHLRLPGELDLVLSIALGYPDPESRINAFRSSRESLDALASWHGFPS